MGRNHQVLVKLDLRKYMSKENELRGIPITTGFGELADREEKL